MDITTTTIQIFTAVVTIASVIKVFLPIPKKTSRWFTVYKLIDILALNILKSKK